ncbi:MAG: hypothetical protein ACI4HI_17455 [Lachnospiraceae bacterium]
MIFLALLGSIVAIVIGLIFMLIAYVLMGISHMKALSRLGYERPWMAWIPFGCYYACADVASEKKETVTLFGSIQIPAVIYKWWWVAVIVMLFLPIGKLATALSLIARIVFLGDAYANMYARLENRPTQDTLGVGIVSGFIPLVAIIKFFIV